MFRLHSLARTPQFVDQLPSSAAYKVLHGHILGASAGDLIAPDNNAMRFGLRINLSALHCALAHDRIIRS